MEMEEQTAGQTDRQPDEQTDKRTEVQRRTSRQGRQVHAIMVATTQNWSKIRVFQGFLNQTTRVIQVNWSILKLKLRTM